MTDRTTEAQYTVTEPEAYVMHSTSLAPVTPIRLTLKVNGKTIPFELDTGCAITLCSQKTWMDTFGPNALQTCSPPKYRLKTYTGGQLHCVDCSKVVLENENQRYDLSIHITEGEGVNLLGRDWLRGVPVLRVYHTIAVSSIGMLLKRYESLFNNPEEGKL